MSAFLLDLRYSFRRVFSRPGFVVTTVLSLGLGVGVNATFFSAANTLLIQPMQVPRSGELVRVYRGQHSPFSYRDYAALRERTATIAGLIAETSVMASFSQGGEPQRARVSLMSGNVFSTLELMPALGRLFVRADDRQRAEVPEVVVSHAFWRVRLGSDPAVVGRTVRLNDGTFTIIGVAPEGFVSSQKGWGSDLFVALGDLPALTGVAVDSMGGSLYVSGRLAPGRSVDDAQAELGLIARQLAAADRERFPRGEFPVKVRHARGVTEEIRTPATIASALVIGLAALILVIAATNVGNVLLARNTARRRELGVRMALGASRQRLVRLLVLESAIIAVLSGAAAMAMAAWTTRLIPRIIPPGTEVYFDLTPDWRVLVFTGLASLVALCIFGLLPALQTTRSDIVEGIKQESGVGSRSGARLRRRFLLVQVTLCTVLLATGSLFLRSLGRAQTVDPGFRTEHMLIAPYFDLQNVSQAEGIAFYDRLLDESSRIPGVVSVSLSGTPELTGSNSATGFFREGEAATSDNPWGTMTYFNVVGPHYHANLGIALVKGRDFAPTDVAGSPAVAIVNETFAARTWPGQDPVGRRISIDGSAGPFFEIVGVSRNVKYHTLGEDAKMFLTVPYAQRFQRQMSLELRLAPTASLRDVSRAVGALVRSLRPSMAPPEVQPLTEMQKLVLLPAKMAAALLGGIGALALLLAVVGITGVASHAVTQRRREIGVRVALGAQPAALLRAVLGETGRTVAIGAGVGLVLALVVGKVVSGMLYGLPFADPVTFVAVPLLLVLMALLAAFQPARRAIGVQPAEALRSE
jgi:predicted permease